MSTNTLRVYVAGPGAMRNVPEFGFPAFMAAEAELMKLGHDIFNPAQRDLDTGFDPTGMTGFESLNDGTHRFSLRDALGADVAWIAERADVICLLPGWEKSSGALAEMALAAALGLKAGALWEIALVASSVDLRDAKDILDEMLDARAADRAKARQGMVEAPALTGLVRAVGHTGKAYVPAHPDGPPVLWDKDDRHMMMVAPHVHSADGQCIKARSGQLCPPPISISGSVTSGGEVRLTSPTGGQKGDKEARFDLIPVGALWWLAVLMGRGAKKYTEYGECECSGPRAERQHEPGCPALSVVHSGERNWESGYDWHLSYSSFQRHGNAFWNGEDFDPETGVPHLINAVFHAFGMVTWMQTHPEFDDRPARLQLAQ